MRRFAALFLLIVGLASGTWLRDGPRKTEYDFALRIERLPVPSPAVYRPHLGPFALKAIWQLDSPRSDFGGFSSLLPPREGRLVAYSDRGWRFEFPRPDRPGESEASFGSAFRTREMRLRFADIESATRDPATGTVWLGVENSNAILRSRASLRFDGVARPDTMRDWGENSGPEALVRLADGQFIVLREGFDDLWGRHWHRALLFAGDPVVERQPIAFRFRSSPGFRPTDMAQMPDGRVLILERKLLWPFPPKLAGRITIADPREIRAGGTWRSLPVAYLSSSLPVDNFEGIAIEQETSGQLTVWLISDDNRLRSQRTLLWKLSVDPDELPFPRGRASVPRQSAE